MKIGIIGAGVMGLTLAYRLSQAGFYVEILESNNQPGGLSTWSDYETFCWDKFYHVILKQDRALLDLIHQLGLEERIRWKNTKTGFLWNKTLISMSNYREFLRFPVLNFSQKIRFAFGTLYACYIENRKNLVGKTAKKWLTGLFGQKIFQAIWSPLLGSKYGALKDKIPATFIFETLRRYHGTRNPKDGEEWMGYLSGGGLKVLIDQFVKELNRGRHAIHYNQRVLGIETEDSGVQVKTDSRTYRYDKLLSTVSSSLLNQWIPLKKTEKEALPNYLGVIRLALVLKHSLSPFYVTNLIDSDLPYTGIIEVSQAVDRDEFGGRHLVMIPRYDTPDSPWFEMSDEEIKKKFVDSLKECWPEIESWILYSDVKRERVVQTLWLDKRPEMDPGGRVGERIWSINAQLSDENILSNNAMIKVSERVSSDLIALFRKEAAHV